MCVQVRSQMLAYQEGILAASDSVPTAAHSAVAPGPLGMSSLDLCLFRFLIFVPYIVLHKMIIAEQNKSANDIQSAGQPQSGTELASRVSAALTDAAAYLRFLGRLAAEIDSRVLQEVAELQLSAWAPVSSDFRVAPVTSTMERKMNRDGVMGQAAMFYPIYSLENLVCDNLGGNKPALSSAKERASLRFLF
ncbi:hypothetical protein MJG53_004951 [Ovis ammon polii x Ovis aries]|uniref:Uncharacterized protein n=1 Tax=Ovis ammon polii x Ovis aries TaxID=2918886 RepID=A0ACB9VB09_9CETA|nr:hypothetical protein MJT46_002981 [Ovis ammon polii x Ovis aries]KAI4587164.1 hypothetical protein MJG53_004951 [Ovis ammon polii x Ovis aries]